MKYERSKKGKRRHRAYIRRNKNKVAARRKGAREEKKIRIVAKGTEAEARRYGCIMAWRKFRCQPILDTLDQTVQPRNRKLPKVLGLDEWKRRNFASRMS